MKNIKSWWELATGRQRLLFGLTGGLLAALLVIGATGIIMNIVKPTKQETVEVTGLNEKADSNDSGSSSSATGEKDDDSKKELENNENSGETSSKDEDLSAEINSDKKSEEETGGEFILEIDEKGLAVMPVTSDPARAAVGAATVMFTTDFSLPADEYFAEVIKRVTKPTPEYKGPEGEVHTRINYVPFKETEYFYKSAEQELTDLMESMRALVLGPGDEELIHHWVLPNDEIYENLQQIPDLKWRSNPIQVVGEEEMLELFPKAVPKFRGEADQEPDTPGATLSHWWVLQEVEGAEVGSEFPRRYHPIHYAIWCDAPEDSGACGVAYMLYTKMPPKWDR